MEGMPLMSVALEFLKNVEIQKLIILLIQKVSAFLFTTILLNELDVIH